MPVTLCLSNWDPSSLPLTCKASGPLRTANEEVDFAGMFGLCLCFPTWLGRITMSKVHHRLYLQSCALWQRGSGARLEDDA